MACVAEVLLWPRAADYFEFCRVRLNINNDKQQRHATHIDLDLDTDAETDPSTDRRNRIRKVKLINSAQCNLVVAFTDATWSPFKS